jgi:hypothetical protein
MLGTPAAFIVSLVGLFVDTDRRLAIAGTLVSAAALLLFFVLPWLFR